MADETSKAEMVVKNAIASGKLDDLKSYLERGRRYGDLTDAELEELWIDGVKVWSDGPFRPSISLNDCDAEYALRGATPPFDLVAADIDKATVAITARVEAMPDDKRYEANAAMIADYERVSRSPN
jgi:hypothetical protein